MSEYTFADAMGAHVAGIPDRPASRYDFYFDVPADALGVNIHGLTREPFFVPNPCPPKGTP